MLHDQILTQESSYSIIDLQNGNARYGVFVGDCIILAPIRGAEYEIYLTRRSRLPCLGEASPRNRGSILSTC